MENEAVSDVNLVRVFLRVCVCVCVYVFVYVSIPASVCPYEFVCQFFRLLLVNSA